MILDANLDQYKEVKSSKKSIVFNVCAPNNRASKYTKHKLIKWKGKLRTWQLQSQHFVLKYNK